MSDSGQTGSPGSRPIGRRFTHLYLERGEPTRDSERMRTRLCALFFKLPISKAINPSAVIREELGVYVQNTDTGIPWWTQWFAYCELGDLLDAVTVIWKAVRPRDLATASAWLTEVARIFEEENVGYRLDNAAGVHFLVDQEFEHARSSTIAVLQAGRYAAVRKEFEDAYRALDEVPADTKGGVRATFNALEILFKLMFPRAPRLGGKEITDHLRPAVDKLYRADPATHRAANRIVGAFTEWVEGAHNYRHEEGVEEPTLPPLPLALVFMSTGAGFLRWLAEMDALDAPTGKTT